MQVASRWGCACGDACYQGAADLDGDGDSDVVAVASGVSWVNPENVQIVDRSGTPPPVGVGRGRVLVGLANGLYLPLTLAQ